ncbi:MAG TPA: 30S ribosome-binding factor RbfA [Candidatus Eisenbacteria bacterium]|nr:30S ribosome-binding factor RbfA [Candidatus Eisenbacteria bacterium]
MSPGESPRTRRVADRIVVEMAEILTSRVEDPRLRTLTVTGAKVSRDLSAARVWVSGNVPEGEEHAVLGALRHAAPYFRSLLAPRLQLRIVPTLQFEIDRSIDTGARIERILRDLREGEAPGSDAPDPEGE